MKTIGWKKVQTVIRRHHGRNQNKGELVVRKLVVCLIICLLLCGCSKTVRLVFVNKTHMDLTIRIDYYPVRLPKEKYEGYEGVSFQENCKIDGLFFQNQDYILRLNFENQGEKKYIIHAKETWGFYTHMYIAILPNWTLAVYDSMENLESPIDKTQYLILPLNPENESQQK